MIVVLFLLGQENETDLELRRHQGLTDYHDGDDIYPPRPTSPPRRRRRRYVSQQRFVEVMVVADAEMKRFHGADLEHYLLTLMAIVGDAHYQNSLCLSQYFHLFRHLHHLSLISVMAQVSRLVIKTSEKTQDQDI